MEKLFLACLYCGESMEVNSSAIDKFGHPNCCDHKMIDLDSNFIVKATRVGIPKLLAKLEDDMIKNLF